MTSRAAATPGSPRIARIRRVHVAALVAAASVALVFAGCGSGTPSREAGRARSSPLASPLVTAASISPADAAAVRRLVREFWKAYNAYDAPRVVSYLEEGYRPAKEPVVRDEIRRLKAFSVKLGVSEASAPVLVGPDEAEILLSVETPTGDRRVQMRLVRRSGRWFVSSSEEVR